MPGESMPGERGLTTEPRPAWRERVGGPWAVSWQGWIATAPLAILTYPLVEPGVGDAGDALAWVAVATAGWLALGAVAWLAGHTVLRDRRSRPAPWLAVLLVGAIAGLARSMVVGLLAAAWGVDGDVPLSSRMLPGALIGVLWIVVTALMADAIADYRSRRRQLVDRAIDVHRDRLVQRQQAEELQEELLGALRDQLEEVSARLPDPAGSPDLAATEVARAIRQSALDAVRPLSHRLSAPPGVLVLPSLRVREVIDQVAGADRLRAWPVLLVLAAINLPLLARGFGMAVALVTLGSFAALLAAGTAALRSGLPASRGRFVAWLGAGSGCAVLTAPAMLAVGMPADSVGRWVAAAVVCVPVMQVAMGLALAVEPLRELSLERLDDFVGRQQLERWAAERELAELRGRVARFLHGSVQSGLLAAALAVDAAGHSPDAADDDRAPGNPAELALARARAALAADVGAALCEPDWVPVSDLERIAAAWQGLVGIGMHVDVDAALVPRQVAAITQEAIADAVRHGGARSIAVRILTVDAGIEVFVEDDGTPMSGPPGLGSALLDRCTHGQWSRGSSPAGGTLLWARLPAGHPA